MQRWRGRRLEAAVHLAAHLQLGGVGWVGWTLNNSHQISKFIKWEVTTHAEKTRHTQRARAWRRANSAAQAAGRSRRRAVPRTSKNCRHA